MGSNRSDAAPETAGSRNESDARTRMPPAPSSSMIVARTFVPPRSSAANRPRSSPRGLLTNAGRMAMERARPSSPARIWA